MSRGRFLPGLYLAAALAHGGVAAAAEPLQMPEPIRLPRQVDTDKLKGPILDAVARRKWLAEADLGDAFVVTLSVRSHFLKIRIEYESRQVRFVYVDSRNLDYEIDEGVPYIHKKVNLWLQALADEVRRGLQYVIFDVEPVTVVPPPAPEPPAAAPPAAPAAPAAPPPESRAARLAGKTTVLGSAARLLSRPIPDSPAVAELPAGTAVQLVSMSRNLSGEWWYVNSGKHAGWLHESAFRAPAGNNSPDH